VERIARSARHLWSKGNGGAQLHAEGKFLFDGNEKLYVRGATYGTFAADENGDEFPCAEVVARDFAAMAATGINAVRTYTAPPRRLLDVAQA